MKWLKALFSEDGSVSLMRVMALISLIVGAILAFRGQDNSVIVFVGSAFGGKIWQKSIETKNPQL